MSREPESRLSGWPTIAMALGLGLVFAVVWAGVRPTNFGGTDEWLYIDLASRGVLGIPYAHRPLVLLWTLPAAACVPHTLWSYHFTHASWLFLGGWLVFALARRLLPRWPTLWLLAGVIDLVWAPEDFLRLDGVLLSGYSGFTFGALAAVVLFLESWFHGRASMLVLAGVVAALTARGFEGTLALMAGAPLLLLWLERDRSPRLWRWIGTWWALMALLAAVIAWDLLGASHQGNYQVTGLGLDPHPVRVAARVLGQFAYHLVPLVRVSPHELATPMVGLSVVVFLIAFAITLRLSGSDAPGPAAARELAGAALLGALLAALGYSLLMLSPSILKAARTQFLSGPGIGLFLASAIALVASRLPPRGRHLATAALAAWIVAVGCGRTLAMQREWDEWRSLYPRQHASLEGLTRVAPQLRPHSFVILLADGGTWPTTFTFRHALAYLYPGRARGHAWGSHDFLYPLYLLPQGVLSAPWPVLKAAWGEGPSLYRYDEVVVVRDRGAGSCEILDEWPAQVLGPLPAGASYAPRARVVAPGTLPPSRAILRLGAGRLLPEWLGP